MKILNKILNIFRKRSFLSKKVEKYANSYYLDSTDLFEITNGFPIAMSRVRENFSRYESEFLLNHGIYNELSFAVYFDINNCNISIYKYEDDWFYVKYHFNDIYSFYKCDQFDGLIQFLVHKKIIDKRNVL